MDEDDDFTNPMAALGDYSPEGLRTQWSDYEKAAAAQAQRQAALNQQRFDEGRRRLDELQIGPSRAEQLFALSAAFAAPQRQRGFAGMMANVMPALANMAAVRQNAALRRNEEQRRLEDQYLTGQMEGASAGLTARRQALEALTRMAKPQRQRTGFNPITGELLDMDTGAPVAAGGQPTSGAPTPPKVGEIRDGYRFKGGNPAEQASWEMVGKGGGVGDGTGGFP